MMKKEVNTFAEYMADTERITDAEREQINFQVALIGKMIEACTRLKQVIIVPIN